MAAGDIFPRLKSWVFSPNQYNRIQISRPFHRDPVGDEGDCEPECVRTGDNEHRDDTFDDRCVERDRERPRDCGHDYRRDRLERSE